MTQRHQVVVNDEDQYSTWPADRQPPDGWRAEGFAGSKDECLSHIDEVWRDMRPRSVRLRQDDTTGDTGGDTGGDKPGDIPGDTERDTGGGTADRAAGGAVGGAR